MYRMLIVDDEKWAREGLCAFLDWQTLGIEVVGCARNGTEGLRMAKAVKPQIIVTDILMPVKDGIEMSREIRQLLPDAKIILLSGHDDFAYAKEAFSFQAVDYLLKPVEKPAFEAAMRRVVADLRKEERWHQEQRLLQGMSIAPTVNTPADSMPSGNTPSDTHEDIGEPLLDNGEPILDNGEPILDNGEPILDNGEPIIETIRCLIAQHYAEHFDLGDVSRLVHLTPYYIGELFKEQEGVGFTQYLTDFRLNKARQLLSTTNQQVAHVARSVGIPNRSYFCKLFKDKFGISPGEYRNVLKGRRVGG